ncbi:MAG TPA: isocitrate lyase/PEP mutase family protein [Casimicrobiaceae bacterium]|nr:isocitrate lyase/PEP mutase family protein [Casimicrobiaceae bacterium]
MIRTTLRDALASERPLVTPLAHDALSARLIERAGFPAYTVGGSALLAARHALPDLGLIGLTDMAEGLRDIAAATTLPFFADGDDGYGDVKAVVRMVETYESIGVGGILIEDQLRQAKQQRAERARGVAPREVIAAKLAAALAARRSRDTLIIGRTDAFGVHGLDEALRRGEAFLELGCDGVFIAGVKSLDDYERIGTRLRGALLSAALFEGPDMPWPDPAVLGNLGFGHVSFPASLIFRVAAAMVDTLARLRAHATGGAAFASDPHAPDQRGLLDEALDVARWQGIERRFAAAPAPSASDAP